MIRGYRDTWSLGVHSYLGYAQRGPVSLGGQDGIQPRDQIQLAGEIEQGGDMAEGGHFGFERLGGYGAARRRPPSRRFGGEAWHV